MKRRVIVIGLVISVAGLDWHDLGRRHYFLIAVAVVGLCAIAMLESAHWREHARLERLRGHIALAASNTPLPPVRTAAPDSIDRLYLAVAALIGRRRIAQGELDRRLEQILSALPEAE